MQEHSERIITSPAIMDTRFYYPQETSRYAMFRYIANRYAVKTANGLFKAWWGRASSLKSANPDSEYGNPRHAHGIKDERNIPILAGVLRQDPLFDKKIIGVATYIAQNVIDSEKERPDGGIGNALFTAHFLTVCAYLAEGETRKLLINGASKTGSRTVLPAMWASNLFLRIQGKKPLRLDTDKKIAGKLKKRQRTAWKKSGARKIYAEVCLHNFFRRRVRPGYNQFKRLLQEIPHEDLGCERWADKAHSEPLERLATCGFRAMWMYLRSHLSLFLRLSNQERTALIAHCVFLAFLFYHPSAYLLELVFWAKAFKPEVQPREPESDLEEIRTHERWINSANLYKELHKEKIDWSAIDRIKEVDILCDQTFPERIKVEHYNILKRLFTESPHYDDPERKSRIEYFLV